MINVIQANDPAVFDHLLFPPQSPMHSEYFQNQFNSFSQTLNDIGRKFVETSRVLYDKVNDSSIVRAARAASRQAKGLFHPNDIISLESIEDLRSAQPLMQRYIMAEPTIRAMYHRQLCDGYSDTYHDVEPDKIGGNHYDYRRVMTGRVIEVKDADGEEHLVARNYYDELRPGDELLSLSERQDIIGTWDIIRAFIEAGKDPTDPSA